MRKTNMNALLLGVSAMLVFSAAHAEPRSTGQDAPAVPAAMAPALTASPASTAVDAADNAVAAQLEQLQTEVMLLKARTARAQAQAELDNASGVASSGTAGGMPAVKAIFGRGQALSATLLLGNGATIDAQVGDNLPGGYRVSRIGAGSVTFIKGGREIKTGLAVGGTGLPAMQSGPLMLAPPLPGRG